MIAGVLTAIAAFLGIIAGIVKKSPKIKKSGIGFGIASFLCFGLIFFWYRIATPSFNKGQMNRFSGTYVLHESAKPTLKQFGITEFGQELTLNANGTFKVDSISGLGLEKSGKWKTGGIDGAFEFHDSNGILLEFAFPSGGGTNARLSFHYNTGEWDNPEQILFVKK